MAFPEIVSRTEWIEARTRLLVDEKAETRRRDALNTRRRELPMVRVEKDYRFEGPQGPATLVGLFGGASQLIVQHVMFEPGSGTVCPSCAYSIEELSPGVLAHLRARDTAFALVSRAPFAELERVRASREWGVAPWYSSYGSDFNYDFEVTVDRDRQPRYNYQARVDWLGDKQSMEMPGHSFFLHRDDDVFHTYSTFGRGNEYTSGLYPLLDLTALGRQEAWEDPKGRAPILFDD